MPYVVIVNTLRPRQNGGHFADGIFKCIFVNENVRIPITISLKFVPQGPITKCNNIPALVQIMAWRRPGDKPLPGPIMVKLPTHICATRPQWVKHRVIVEHMPEIKFTGSRALLINIAQVNAKIIPWWLVNFNSDNGLVPSGNKPLSELMLTQIYVAIWRH